MPGFAASAVPSFTISCLGSASYQWDYIYRSTANLSQLTVPTANGFATLANYSSNPHVANLVAAYGGLVGHQRWLKDHTTCDCSSAPTPSP